MDVHGHNSKDSFLPSDLATDEETRRFALNIRHLLSAFLIPYVLRGDGMPGIVRVVLEMLCIETTSSWAFEQIVNWWQDDKWKVGVQVGIQNLVYNIVLFSFLRLKFLSADQGIVMANERQNIIDISRGYS